MSKIITLRFEIEDDEYNELMEHEFVQGDLSSFVFAELCQNYNFGFLIECSVVENIDE